MAPSLPPAGAGHPPSRHRVPHHWVGHPLDHARPRRPRGSRSVDRCRRSLPVSASIPTASLLMIHHCSMALTDLGGRVLDRHDGIAVTGGLGFIGRHLARALLDHRKRVIVLDRRAPGDSDANPDIEYRVVDVREPRSLRDALRSADLVFHLAANANGTYSVEHPGEDFQANCVGTFKVLQAAMEAGVRRVVYVSSASVYGTPRRFPIRESHPTDPIMPYGASKLAGERFGLAFLHSYGLDFVAARPFCVYGPGEDPATSLVEVSRYLRWHLNGRAIQVVGDARRKTRDFIHVSDA